MKKLLLNATILVDGKEKTFGNGLNENSVNETYFVEFNGEEFKVLQYWKSQDKGIKDGKPLLQTNGEKTGNVTTVKIEWADGTTEIWTTETLKNKFCPNRVKKVYEKSNDGKQKSFSEEFVKVFNLVETANDAEIKDAVEKLQSILTERKEAKEKAEKAEKDAAAKLLGFSSYEAFKETQKRKKK